MYNKVTDSVLSVLLTFSPSTSNKLFTNITLYMKEILICLLPYIQINLIHNLPYVVQSQTIPNNDRMILVV